MARSRVMLCSYAGAGSLYLGLDIKVYQIIAAITARILRMIAMGRPKGKQHHPLTRTTNGVDTKAAKLGLVCRYTSSLAVVSR